MKIHVLCFVALLAAQAVAPEVEITNEPHHHLTFENKSVRVFNVEVPPGTETLVHWHRHDYIAITLGAAEVANTVKDKPAVNVKFTDGDTRFVAATFAHFVKDVGAQPFRNVTIELMEDEALRKATSHWAEERGVEILPNGTQEILFVKDGVRATEFELQPGGVVPVHRVGPHLLVAVSDADLRADVVGQGATAAHFHSGESKWYAGNASQSLTNAGKLTAKFITLEFPRLDSTVKHSRSGGDFPGKQNFPLWENLRFFPSNFLPASQTKEAPADKVRGEECHAFFFRPPHACVAGLPRLAGKDDVAGRADPAPPTDRAPRGGGGLLSLAPVRVRDGGVAFSHAALPGRSRPHRVGR